MFVHSAPDKIRGCVRSAGLCPIRTLKKRNVDQALRPTQLYSSHPALNLLALDNRWRKIIGYLVWEKPCSPILQVFSFQLSQSFLHTHFIRTITPTTQQKVFVKYQFHVTRYCHGFCKHQQVHFVLFPTKPRVG